MKTREQRKEKKIDFEFSKRIADGLVNDKHFPVSSVWICWSPKYSQHVVLTDKNLKSFRETMDAKTRKRFHYVAKK